MVTSVKAHVNAVQILGSSIMWNITFLGHTVSGIQKTDSKYFESYLESSYTWHKCINLLYQKTINDIWKAAVAQF